MKFSFRGPRKKQRGFGIAETLLGLALGFVAVVSGTQFMSSTLEATSTASVVQNRTSMIAEALNRTSQNIQVADPILYAGYDELMTKSVDGSGATVMTRFVKSGGAYYHQTWTGFTGSYAPAPGLWNAPTTLSAAAPNGDGKQTSTLLASDLVNGLDLGAEDPAKEIFNYHGSDGALIDVSIPATSTAGNTGAIKLVDVTLAATTEAPSFFQNQTSAAPRNMSAGVTDGTIVAPVCPVVSFGAASTAAQPILNWTTVPGAASYDIYRNATVAANIVVAGGAASGTWKDTANAAAGSDSTTYRVVAKTAAGVASDSCRPAVWRPQIGLPVLVNSTVLPGGVAASGWNGSPLTTPRIVLNWKAVPGASGYQLLYREVNPMTGAQIGSGAYTNIPLDVSVLTYSWDGGGFGKRYEWYLKADARSGQSSESRHIQILTHPSAPATTTVKATYDTQTDGKNVLTWTAASTVSGYDIWRYNAGSTGTAVLRSRTAALSYSDPAPYGSNFTYYIGARNSGPRGTDAAGNDIVEDRSSPSPESAASAANKSDKVTQLQYPPIPTVAPLGAAATNTRDYDNVNRIIWAPAASATGYKVGRFTIGGAALTCLTGTNCNTNSGGTAATQIDDPAGDATQFDYAVVAYNATGMSKAFSAKARLTQRPGPQTLTVTSAPTLSDDTADFQGIQNADAGNPAADKFCTPSTCSYNLILNGTEITWKPHSQSGVPVTFLNWGNAPGSTNKYQFRSKNAAITNNGYSDMPGASVVNTYPGPFATGQSLGDANGWGQTRFRAHLTNTDTSGSSNGIQNGYTTLWFGASSGATWFDYARRTASNKEATSWDANLGLPAPVVKYGSRSGGQSGWWTLVAAPGTLYYHDVIAHAANGLARPVTTGTYWTPPDIPRYGTTMIVCSGNTYSNQTTARNDFPGHFIGARLIAFDKTPLYGDYSGSSIIGMSMYKGQGWWTDTSWTYLEWWRANPNWSSGLASGPGQGYYYGVNSGFRLWNNINGGPNSTILYQSIQALATFNAGCGPYGGRWYDMWEPTWACYGYVPGKPCAANNPWNRPQWRAY
jgi:hypothetical protein